MKFRDVLDLRYLSFGQRRRAFNENHQIVSRCDGAMRNCLGDLSNQVFQPVQGILGAVGVEWWRRHRDGRCSRP